MPNTNERMKAAIYQGNRTVRVGESQKIPPAKGAELPNVRGRILMVAIHPEPKPVNLFKFFWSELLLIGARIYEERDFDKAIELAASGRLHLDELITQIGPMDDFQQTFETIEAKPAGIKYLINCSS